MVYTPTNWDAVTTLTAARLNNLESQFGLAKTEYDTHTHDGDYYTETEMGATFWGTGNDGPGTGMDADQIYHADGNMEAADFAGVGVPSGLVIWYESTPAPSGWHRCDGDAGTINLVDKFVIGAGTGSGYSVGDSAGADSATPTGSVTVANCELTIYNILHSHTLTDRKPTGSSVGVGSGSVATSVYTITPDSLTSLAGGSAPHNHSATFAGELFDMRPPYYALEYIQKT